MHTITYSEISNLYFWGIGLEPSLTRLPLEVTIKAGPVL